MDENRIKEYTLENGKTFTAYIPQNITSDTPVFYYSYVVGSDYETDKLWQGMEENMAKYDGNAIIIIPHDKQLVIGGSNPETHKYQTNAVAAFNLVKEDLNLDTNQFINGGFSAGFGYGTRTLAHYLQENPNAERQILFAVDGVINPTANLQTNELQALKDNNTLIISYTQQKNHQYQANLFKSTDLPILYVVDNSIPENTPDSQYWRIHDQVAKDFYEKGLYSILIDFALGKKELELPEGYSLRYYDPKTKKIRNITIEEATKLIGIEANNKTLLSPKRLQALSSLAILDIESDNEILEASLNDIRSAIRNTKFLQGNFSSISFSSTTKVPSSISNLVSQFFSTSTTLLELLVEDTLQFSKIGASIVELDQQTAQEAEELDNSLNLNNIPNNNSSTTSTNNNLTSNDLNGALIGVGTALNNQNNNTNNNNQSTSSNTSQNNNTSSNTDQSTNSSNQNNSSSKNPSATNSTNSSSNNKPTNNQSSENATHEESTGGIETFYDYETLCSDETKIVYNCNDEYKVIIHKDGENIIGIEYYYDYGTEESALANLESLKQEYSSVEYFDEVIQKDQYVKVLFKEEMYKDLSLNEIREKFSTLEEIVKI